MHNVNLASDASVPLTKCTVEVRNVNATLQNVVALTKCTLAASKAPGFPYPAPLAFAGLGARG